MEGNVFRMLENAHREGDQSVLRPELLARLELYGHSAAVVVNVGDDRR